MSIELSIVIASISLAFALYSGITNMKRGEKNDVASETSQLTTVIVKLENIGNDISEIKSDLRDVKDDVKDHSLRIAKMEQQIRALEKNVFTPHMAVINAKDGDEDDN